MVDQVKSPKSIDTRSQRSIAGVTVAILRDSAIPTSCITLSLMGSLLVNDSMQVICSPWRP